MLDPKWAKLVFKYRAIRGSRVKMLKLKGLSCNILSIINVCMHQTIHQRGIICGSWWKIGFQNIVISCFARI
jgi:hypothetical protein